jgi:hypothetical protein
MSRDAVAIRSKCKGSTMRTVIYGALAALVITTANAAVQEDVHSARLMTELLRHAQASGQAQLEPILCTDIPGDTTIEHLVDVVVKYGSMHPDQTQERFEVLAFTALHDAWPCKR